jgi:hypothetical protein
MIQISSKPDLFGIQIPVKALSFTGLTTFNISQTTDFIYNNIINAPDPQSRKKAVLQLQERFPDFYNKGKDKWQNPRFHQFTVSDHMLKSAEQAALIVNGEHPQLDTLLTPDQKQKTLKLFKDKIDGIDKGTLFVLGMAFHDLDKLYDCHVRKRPDGSSWFIDPSLHKTYCDDQTIPINGVYWKAEPNPLKAIEAFNNLAIKSNLPPGAIKYVNNILTCHDNPLKYITWEIENGERNLTDMFDKMKAETPLSLKELGLVFLADQSAKGESGWVDHLEKISPWKSIFKSLILERPLAELDSLLPEKRPMPILEHYFRS